MSQERRIPVTEVKGTLESWFGQTSTIGVRHVQGHNFLPNGTELSRSTNCGFFVVSTLRSGRVYGYDTNSNPWVREEIIRMIGGHDFALVHGRWIVDLWVSVHADLSTQTVFDLMDASDAPAILRFYGDPGTWQMLLPGTEGYVEPPEPTEYSEALRDLLTNIATAEDAPVTAGWSERTD